MNFGCPAPRILDALAHTLPPPPRKTLCKEISEISENLLNPNIPQNTSKYGKIINPSVIGFLWVFGAYEHLTCGADSVTYQFAFATLIILNIIMDCWICFKICVVLYWAFLTED